MKDVLGGDAEVNVDDIHIADMEFKPRVALLPFKCKETGAQVWPGNKIFVAKEFARSRKNPTNVVFIRVKLSEPEYMLRKLKGEVA